jgi:hypothetical protein
MRCQQLLPSHAHIGHSCAVLLVTSIEPLRMPNGGFRAVAADWPRR